MKTLSIRRLAGLAVAALFATAALTACAPATPAAPAVLSITDPWVKAMPELMKDMNMTALFGVVANPTDETIYLTGGTAIDAKLTQTKLDAHEVVKGDDGKMKMQEVKDGIPVPAHGSVTLKPGSYHIMFWDLKKPIAVGENIEVTLNFSNGSTLKVTAVARDIANYAG
jgi:copper(I)-binding protein